MSSTQASHVSALLDGLASGAVQVVDLTQPLSETTPIIQLPPPFANTPGLSREEISKYDDRGPARRVHAHDYEHVGTHVDAHPLGDGQDGADIGSIRHDAVGPPAWSTGPPETEAAGGDYPLTVADLEAWEAENGRVPDGAGRCAPPARARMTRTCSSTSARTARRRRAPTWRSAPAGPSAWIAGFGPSASHRAQTTGGFDPPFPVHNFLLGAGKLGLTQLANLDQLSVTGAMVVVCPLRLVGGTGSPSRVLAFVPNG
jgi:kynurenine formamidase